MISTLNDGRYRIRVRGFGSERGTATTFPHGTPHDAVVAEHARREALRGTDEITVSVLADEYLANRGKRLSASGYVRAAGIVAEIKADPLGSEIASALRSWHFDDWQERLEDGGNSDGTIDRKSNCLRAILRHAVRRGRLETSPLRLGDLPRRVPSNKKAEDFFTHEQWSAFINADVPERLHEWRPIWRVLLLTGCRLSEILLLRWEQVDLREGVIRIEQGKTGVPKVSYIVPELRELLESLPRGIGKAYVFATMPSGAPRTGMQAHRAFGAYRTAAQLSRVLKVHTLRHTTASWLVQSGTPIRTVQAVLGHASITTTMRYAHLGEEQVRDALGAIGRMVTNG